MVAFFLELGLIQFLRRESMKIVIIVFVGILSYFAVVLPGYFYFVPGVADEILNLKTLTELPVKDAPKSSTKLNITNPGDAPALK